MADYRVVYGSVSALVPGPFAGPEPIDPGVPVYPLPTTRYAGQFLIQLDPLIDWSAISEEGIIHAEDGTAWLDYVRIPVDGGGTENRVISYSISDAADQPVATLRATLHMRTENGSLSMSADSFWNNLSGVFSPAIYGGRRILIQEPLGEPDSLDPDDWRPIFWGRIDDHPVNSAGDLQIFARAEVAQLMIPYIGEPVWIGVEGQLVPVAEALQWILDFATTPAEWVIYSPVDLDWAFPAFRMSEVPDVLQLIRDTAQQRGAVVRWWYDEGTERFQLTLFVLQVNKESPDLSFGPGQTLDISAHHSDLVNYRNDFTIRWIQDGILQTLNSPASDEERLAFGWHPLVITNGSTEQINSEEEAAVMLASVENLRIPATIGARVIPYTPDVRLNTLLEFTPDGRVSSATEELYVVAWSHDVVMAGDQYQASTTVQVRGAPAGQLGAWLRSFARSAVAPSRTVLRRLRLPFTAFRPTSETISYEYVNEAGVMYLQPGSLEPATFMAPVEIPRGAVIRIWRVRYHIIGVLSGGIVGTLRRIEEDGSWTDIADPFTLVPTDGWTTLEVVGLAEVVGDAVYVSTLALVPFIAPDSVRFLWAEVVYEEPTPVPPSDVYY